MTTPLRAKPNPG